MELTRSQSIKLGRFVHDLCSRFNGDKPWLTPRKLRTAIEKDSNLLSHIAEDGSAVLLDDQLRADVQEVVESIPENSQSTSRLAELEADIQNPAAMQALSRSGRMAIVHAIVAGLKGEERKARVVELKAKLEM